MTTKARQIFLADSSWTAPGGCNRVSVYANPIESFFLNKALSVCEGSAAAIDIYKNVWAWGVNSNTMLGIGATGNTSSPVKVVGGLSLKALQIIPPNELIQFLDAGGVLYSSGAATGGQRGDGQHVGDVSSPVQVLGGVRFKSLINITKPGVTGIAYPCGAIDAQNYLWTWGANPNGSSGQGSPSATTSSPVKVVGGIQFQMATVGIDGGNGVSVAGLDTSGNMWCWGVNTSGEAGQGSTSSSGYSSPVQVIGGVKFQFIWEFNNGIANKNTIFGLDLSNNLWALGGNAGGVLGAGLNPATTVSVSSPVQVLGGVKFSTQLAFSPETNTVLALDLNGACWGWGGNGSGVIGRNNTTPVSSPVQMLGGLVFRRIVIGGSNGSFIGVTKDDVLYACGDNQSGQLGTGNVTPFSSPVQVLGSIAFSQNFTMDTVGNTNLVACLASDISGVLWSWGYNGTGQGGTGNTTTVSSPVQILGNIAFNPFSPQQVYELDVVPGTTYDVKINAMFTRFGNQYLAGFASSVVVEFDQ